MSEKITIGFIGLGVMGLPMCLNIAKKHKGQVLAFDLSAEALSSLSGSKAKAAKSLEYLVEEADIIFMSLPGGAQVEQICLEGPINTHASPDTIIVDLSTTQVSIARKVAAKLAKSGVKFADCPVARTREAAQKGELSIMVGASDHLFGLIKPYLDYMATDITHGGDVGAGQVLKLVNNMLVFENVVALAEMMVLGEKAGVNPEKVLEAVSKGSGDSFVLRNHGIKAMLPRKFPDKAFPSEYVLKDINYVFELAEETGVSLEAAKTVRKYYQKAIEHGLGGQYFPTVINIIENDLYGKEDS